jgi:ferredoxin
VLRIILRITEKGGKYFMAEKSSKLSRRKFMLVGSAAVASPLLLNAARSIAADNAATAKPAETSIAPKGTKIYYINDGCVGCQACRTFCPVQAIRFGNCRNEIDQKKCIHCGTCYRECNNSVISETILQ